MPVTIQPVYDSADEVPEPLREYTEERDGKVYFAKPIDVETLDEVANLKKALDSERKGNKENGKKVGEYEKQMKTLQDELADLKKSGGSSKDKEEVQRQIDALKAGHSEELRKANETSGQYKSRIHKLLVRTATNDAIAEAKPLSAVALRPHVEAALKVVDDDGEERVIVVDEKGEELYNSKTGKPFTPAEYALSLRDRAEFKPLFPGSGGSGGGGEGNGERKVTFGKRRVTRAQLKDAAFYEGLEKEAKDKGVDVSDLYEVTG